MSTEINNQLSETQRKILYDVSSVHGIGVFACRDIQQGELIEKCPMIPLAFRARYHTDPQLYKYLYPQPMCECLECKNHGFILHMLLGYGMLYNHNDDPNAEWVFDWKQLFANLIAKKDIKQTEEIFVSYDQKNYIGHQQINDINEKATEKQ